MHVSIPFTSCFSIKVFKTVEASIHHKKPLSLELRCVNTMVLFNSCHEHVYSSSFFSNRKDSIDTSRSSSEMTNLSCSIHPHSELNPMSSCSLSAYFWAQFPRMDFRRAFFCMDELFQGVRWNEKTNQACIIMERECCTDVLECFWSLNPQHVAFFDLGLSCLEIG